MEEVSPVPSYSFPTSPLSVYLLLPCAQRIPIHTILSHSSKLSDLQLGPRSLPWKLEMVSLETKESANMLRELEDKETC